MAFTGFFRANDGDRQVRSRVHDSGREFCLAGWTLPAGGHLVTAGALLLECNVRKAQKPADGIPRKTTPTAFAVKS